MDTDTSTIPPTPESARPDENSLAVAPTPLANGTPVSSNVTPDIDVVHLYRHFGKLKAVDDVSFRAMPGQVVGFIGPNGAGKSTTMRILATLDVPNHGDAFVCGYSVITDPDSVRKVMGFMPDNFGRYSDMSVREYLDFFARAYGLHGSRRRDAMDRVMTFTELDRIPDKPVDTLSKGLSQRLGLGRTLIHDPQVLILDEPAAGLDPRARVELRELILLLSTQLKKTILISSHILTELGEICDSACVIEAGRVLAWGTIEEIHRKLNEIQGKAAGHQIHVQLGTPANGLERWLLQRPFVEEVTESSPNQLTFTFSGDDKARFELLKQMVLEDFQVLEFHGKVNNLEDAFMAITKGVMQ